MAILDLLPKLKATKCFSQDELNALEIEAWNGQIDIALDKAAEMNSQPLATFEKIWKEVPAKVKKQASTVTIYTRKLLKAGFVDKAMEVVTQALKQNWDASLLWIYGNLSASDKRQQLLQAESWLREHPVDPALFYVLGKLAKENELWGKAREYLENSLTVKPSAQAYAELAGLLAQLGEHKQSLECYQQGLLLSSN